MRSALASALILSSACSASAEPATKAERAWIVEYFKQTLNDPYSLRSTGISEVQTLKGYNRQIPSGICVQFNAKNAVGGYAGLQRLVFVRTERGLVYGDWRQNVSDQTCLVEGVTYRPFPELASIR